MRFVLVYAPLSDDDAPHSVASQKWGNFYALADLGHISQEEGVFVLSREALLFDLTKNLPRFSRTVYAAHEQKVRLFVLPIADETEFSYVQAPEAEQKKLIEFLKTS